MWTIEKYKEVYARYETSGLSVEQFCMNEMIVRSRFYYWLRKYRKLPDKSMTIKNNSADDNEQRKEPGFIPVWIAPLDTEKLKGEKERDKKADSLYPSEQHSYMEISYQNGTTVRLGGERDMELVKTLILLSR